MSNTFMKNEQEKNCKLFLLANVYKNKGIKEKEDEMKIKIEGMMCEHCEMTVKKHLRQFPG